MTAHVFQTTDNADQRSRFLEADAAGESLRSFLPDPKHQKLLQKVPHGGASDPQEDCKGGTLSRPYRSASALSERDISLCSAGRTEAPSYSTRYISEAIGISI